MMRRMTLSMAAVLAILLCSLASISAGTLLLQDDFKGYKRGTDAFPMWIAHSGEWTVTEDGFQGIDCGGNFTALGVTTGRKEWTDYALSLRLRIISRGSDWRDGPWVGFRYTNSANAYTLGFYNRLTALHKASRGKTTGDENALAQSVTTIKDNEWHDLEITVVGGKITVVLDGATIIEATDANWNDSPPVASGGVALAARKYENSEGKTQVVFSDLRVESITEVAEAMKFTMEDAKRAAAGFTHEGAKMTTLEFLKTRRDRRWTRVPRRVMAFYYTWYGRPENHGDWVHWSNVKPEEHDIASATHYPAKGAYDSHDPALIDYQIDLAKSNGIDAFISTWWGQGDFTDRALVKVLGRAEKKDFQVTIYWETVPGKGRAKIERAISDLTYVLEKYGAHPAFLKLDGKPVIFVYERVMGQIGLNEWPEIITRVGQLYGDDFLLIADGYRESYARLFDGVHTYNICGWVQGKTPEELRAISGNSFKSAVETAKNNAKVSCITIIPGYDDTKIRKPGLNAQRLGGETYRVLWEEAIAADPDWVLITSWNEWHEGSEIEPSWEDGDKYIKMTGKYAPLFKKTRYSRIKIPETPSSVSPEKARALRELYKGKTIGVLPDFSGKSVLWLADTGVRLKELTWEEVLDSDQFNVEELPVVVYAGFEGYTQTVKEKGDVDAAIVRYLGEGGLLMALPSGPFPFYYNEEGQPVVSSRKLGIPIAGSGVFAREDVAPDSKVKGWESPPPGVKLTFRIDRKLLPDLPLTVAFPETGDLRWRPSAGSGLPDGDIYLPLAQLKDEKGDSYGDGIIYIEHKVSNPKNGKNIYAWMRMLDALNAEDVLYDLFRMAGERMAR